MHARGTLVDEELGDRVGRWVLGSYMQKVTGEKSTLRGVAEDRVQGWSETPGPKPIMSKPRP